jgi:hypothetical protein
MLPLILFLMALAIIAMAIAWAWRNDTLHASEQEHIDLKFDHIVRRLDLPTR